MTRPKPLKTGRTEKQVTQEVLDAAALFGGPWGPQMKFAYADPPCLGCGAMYAKLHPDGRPKSAKNKGNHSVLPIDI